jgi:hypothetical protein
MKTPHMGIRKEIPIITCAFVVTALAFIALTFKTPEARVIVDPDEITVNVDDTFKINVGITAVVDLSSYNFILYYDTAPIDGVSVELPQGHFLNPFSKHEVLETRHMEIHDNYNDTHGQIIISVKLISTAPVQGRVCTFQRSRLPIPARSGSGVLFTMTFHCTNTGTSSMDLCRTNLYKYGGVPISHTPIHGHISAHSKT